MKHILGNFGGRRVAMILVFTRGKGTPVYNNDDILFPVKASLKLLVCYDQEDTNFSCTYRRRGRCLSKRIRRYSSAKIGYCDTYRK